MAAPAVAMPGTWPATARGFSLPVQALESCSESSCLLRVQLSPLPPSEAESKSATDKDSKKKPRRRKKKKEEAAAAEPEASLSASAESQVDVGRRRSTWGGGFAHATAFFFSKGCVARRVLETSVVVLVPASCLALWWRERRGGAIVTLLVFGGLLSSRVIRGRRDSSRAVAAHGRGGAQGRSKKKKVSRNKATSLDTGSEASLLDGEGAKKGRSVFKRGTKLEVDVADDLSLAGAATAMGGVRRSSMGGWKHAGDGKDEEGGGGGGGGEDGEDEGEGPQLSLEELHAAIIRPRGCFGRDMSVARWRDEEGVAEVVRLRGRSWTAMGIIRDGRNLLLPEECVFLVERGTLLLLMGEDDRIASVQEAYSLLEPSIPSLSDPLLACHLDAYIAYAYLKRLGYVVGRHGVPFTLPKCPPPNSKTSSTSADTSATSAGIHASSAVTATTSALGTAENDGTDAATCPFEEREFPVDHETASGTVGRCQDRSGGEKSRGDSAGTRGETPSTSADTSAMSADIDARSADTAAMSELGTMAENDGIDAATCPVEERDCPVDHETAAGTASTDSARCRDGIEGEMCRGESAGARGKAGAGAPDDMWGEDLGAPRLERGSERGRESASCRSGQSVSEDSQLMFDVYRPNTRFRKSCPGDPLFSLVVSSERPPSRATVKEAQAAGGSVPVKFAAVNSGSVTIFAFDSISLPVLP